MLRQCGIVKGRARPRPKRRGLSGPASPVLAVSLVMATSFDVQGAPKSSPYNLLFISQQYFARVINVNTHIYLPNFIYKTRICAAEMAVRYVALSACRKVRMPSVRAEKYIRDASG